MVEGVGWLGVRVEVVDVVSVRDPLQITELLLYERLYVFSWKTSL